MTSNISTTANMSPISSKIRDNILENATDLTKELSLQLVSEATENSVNFNGFPNEIIRLIFNYLSPRELLISVALVCSRWNELVRLTLESKPITLILSLRDYHHSGSTVLSDYSKQTLINYTLLSFYEIPLCFDQTACDVLWLNLKNLDDIISSEEMFQSLSYLKNVTQLVICSPEIETQINRENLYDFLKAFNFESRLTHLKLLFIPSGKKRQWDLSILWQGPVAGFNWHANIWQVLDKFDFTSLRHLGIYSENVECLRGIETGILSRLTQFYCSFNENLSEVFEKLNSDCCASIGIYWNEKKRGRVRVLLNTLRTEKPNIWEKVTRINDCMTCHRNNFNHKYSILNYLHTDSIRHFHLNLRSEFDYQVQHTLVASRLPNLETLHIWLSESSQCKRIFRYVSKIRKLKPSFPRQASRSVRSIQIIADHLSNCQSHHGGSGTAIYQEIFGKTNPARVKKYDESPDLTTVYEAAMLLFPNLNSLNFIVHRKFGRTKVGKLDSYSSCTSDLISTQVISKGNWCPGRLVETFCDCDDGLDD